MTDGAPTDPKLLTTWEAWQNAPSSRDRVVELVVVLWRIAPRLGLTPSHLHDLLAKTNTIVPMPETVRPSRPRSRK